jgi:hypothetical protein
LVLIGSLFSADFCSGTNSESASNSRFKSMDGLKNQEKFCLHESLLGTILDTGTERITKKMITGDRSQCLITRKEYNFFILQPFL